MENVFHHTIIPLSDTVCNGKCFPTIPTLTSASASMSSSDIFSQSELCLNRAIKRGDFPNFDRLFNYFGFNIYNFISTIVPDASLMLTSTPVLLIIRSTAFSLPE